MFIYEFMGGVLESFTGDEETEENFAGLEEEAQFDPHKHRKVEKPTTYSETMTHMLKGSIGAGILAMPQAFRRMGVVYGLLGVVTIGAFATYCIQLLIAGQYELCKLATQGYMSYPKSIFAALKKGPPCVRRYAKCMAVLIDVVLVVWQLGLCGVYTVFVAENVKQVCDFYGVTYSIRIHICILLLPLLALNMVKSLKLLSPVSSVSNVITMLGLILVFYYLLEDDLVVEAEHTMIKSLTDIPVFIGTTLFALEAVGVILALEYNMENPKLFVGWFGLLDIAMSIILCAYGIVGAFGYLKYGDDIEASITLNLPYEQKKAQAAKLILALAIFLSFPLQNFVAYNVIWHHIKFKYAGFEQIVADYVLRAVLVLIPRKPLVYDNGDKPATVNELLNKITGAFGTSTTPVSCLSKFTRLHAKFTRLDWKLCKFSDSSMMVNESIGWWCQIPRFSIRGNSPEPKLNKPRSQSSPLLRSGAASPERRNHQYPPLQLPPNCTSHLGRNVLDAVQLQLGLGGKDYSVDAAHFAPWPPSEPITVLAVDAPPLSHSTHADKLDKAAWSCLKQERDALWLEEPLWLMPQLSRESRPRGSHTRTLCARHNTGTGTEKRGGARRDVRRLLRGLIASLPLCSSSHKNIVKTHRSSNCNVAVSVQALTLTAPPSSRSVSVQAKTVPCVSDEAVCPHCDMQTNNVGEPKRPRPKEGWTGGVRALRDSHVRLVLRQLRHIERLNRALDHPPKH